ncbi:MAG: hypothetical protein ACRDSK_02500 [Actinophytocola sp.]|uniref:hypothetical protein n=1 Tax=Actinophytocola sp. TaxID=1872138 RepID=UPI003D6AB2E8
MGPRPSFTQYALEAHAGASEVCLAHLEANGEGPDREELRAAKRLWVRAVREADRLGMPYERACAHHELGRHLEPGERSALGLDQATHLARAIAGYEAVGAVVPSAGAPPRRAGQREPDRGRRDAEATTVIGRPGTDLPQP